MPDARQPSALQSREHPFSALQSPAPNLAPPRQIELCNDKDAQIAAVLAEGEALSKRQAEQEQTIRKLRLKIRDTLAANEEQAEATRALREELSETKTKLERALEEIAEARRLHDTGGGPASGPVGLAEGAGGAVGVEGVAAAPAEQTLALQRALRQVESAEAREASLAASLTELQLENARLSHSARWRDEGLSTRLGELETRSDNAEALAGELAAAVARETQPLLKQVASLQSRLSQVQAAWQASEGELRNRLAQAERAATAHGEEAAQHLSALAAAEGELSQARERAEAERVRLCQSRDAAEGRAAAEARRATHAEAEVARVRHVLERAEAAVAKGDRALEEERERGSSLSAELQREREALSEERRARAQQMSGIRAQQVQARVHAGSAGGCGAGAGNVGAGAGGDWRAAALLQPMRGVGVGAAGGGAGGAASGSESGGLRALIAAMQAKEQVSHFTCACLGSVSEHHPGLANAIGDRQIGPIDRKSSQLRCVA